MRMTYGEFQWWANTNHDLIYVVIEYGALIWFVKRIFDFDFIWNWFDIYNDLIWDFNNS